ncbi:sensor histidine kinase [Taibaiella sp. KBW10]|uniref:sensor histidine kinase n=1 Tax=Taibaiella sp. KBW10 TaxID=2153357 RepID=UPI000F5B65A3|nr:HAMP domain-containing sensor histidine kinase [Taibaiella sp. KBW10]RQO32667.1 sensor histidine kinase [Taibaiella sp. KBW10]
MKNLLQKSLKPFIIYALLVLAASVPVYYLLVDNIWQKELDEHNQIVAARTAYQLNQLQLNQKELDSSIVLWNRMQPETSLQKAEEHTPLKDSSYTLTRMNTYTPAHVADRFRGLRKNIKVNGTSYILTIETNIEETEETVLVIALATLLFFIVLVVGLVILNRRLSQKLWQPFQSTLKQLKSFRLHQQQSIHFETSDTLEFEQLNEALSKLIHNNIAAYAIQKEFTENAAHELQTPLAIIKNKLDLLLQKDALTDRQYQIIEDLNKSLSRISRINKNLLLLAKIENQQFDATQEVNISALIEQSIKVLGEHIEHKGLEIDQNIGTDIQVKGNITLVELLIQNLLLNAIRHTPAQGHIRIVLHAQQLIFTNSGTNALDSAKLFQRFTRQSNDTGGTGLGLAIIEQICQFHGWTVHYAFQNGTHTFSVDFSKR